MNVLVLQMTNCSTVFTCASEFEIIGIHINGHGWFFGLIMIAFWLQILTNFIWLKNSQLSREIMQLDIGNCERKRLIWISLLWTAGGTIVWIARIMLIIGNNLWIYLTVLIGNVVGTYWASTTQKPDKHSLIGDMEALLQSENPKVNLILKGVHERMTILSAKQTSNSQKELNFSS